MKTLSVRQPYASLLCAGIKDIENRSWKPTKLPCRILIHASSAKIPKSWSKKTSPWIVSQFAAWADMGWIPSIDEMPTSAIIGYVDVVGVTTESDSVWADENSLQWQLTNAYVFDEPIRNVKGKLNLFEYDLDENNLPPAHPIQRILPKIEKDTFIFTHTDAKMDRDWDYYQSFQQGDNMFFDDSEEISILIQEDNSILPVKYLQIQDTSQTRIIRFEVTQNGLWIENKDTDAESCSFVFTLGKKVES